MVDLLLCKPCLWVVSHDVKGVKLGEEIEAFPISGTHDRCLGKPQRRGSIQRPPARAPSNPILWKGYHRSDPGHENVWDTRYPSCPIACLNIPSTEK